MQYKFGQDALRRYHGRILHSALAPNTLGPRLTVVYLGAMFGRFFEGCSIVSEICIDAFVYWDDTPQVVDLEIGKTAGTETDTVDCTNFAVVDNLSNVDSVGNNSDVDN